jgi:glycolate oxidase FAD binding subunit
VTEPLAPRDSNDVAAALSWALAEGRPVDVVGQGSKRLIGPPPFGQTTLDLSALAGIVTYEPAELVLTVRAATPIAEIEMLLESQGQQLAFEPMDYGALLGGPAGRGTLGGVLASNLSGPRRLKAGAARDHFLGVAAVSGRGEAFRAGGRVVKNVTGYDICKLLAGSWGTLAVMTEATIKVLPKPETEISVVALGLDDGAAVRAMTAAMASACEVAGAAHLPAAVAARSPIGELVASGRALTVLRLEGVVPSVAHRQQVLVELLRDCGEVHAVDDFVSRRLWRAVRDVTPFAADLTGVDAPLWRIATTPSRAAEVAATIASATANAPAGDPGMLYDLAGGLIWALLPPSHDAGAGPVRAALAAAGGHATLVRAPASVRAAVDMCQPQHRQLAALTRRVKDSFDPRHVLNPGRMWAGV